MKKLIWITISIVLTKNSIAQINTPYIEIDTKLTSVEKSGAKLKMVDVIVFKNARPIDSMEVGKSRFYYTLDTGQVYKIVFKKNGYVAKHLLINTTNAPKGLKKDKLKVEVSLFEYRKEIDMDFLHTSPIGIASFNRRTKKLEWDSGHTAFIIQKIIEATLQGIGKKEQ